MKKILFSVVCLVMIGMQSVMAQKSLVATLSHNGETTQFYGANAFQNANDAAEDGDFITLSSGYFGETTITKKLTIRGAGFKKDLTVNLEPTKIGRLFIDDNISNVSIEGVNIITMEQGERVNNDIYMTKCKIDCFRNNGGDNWFFVNCILPDIVSHATTTTYYYNCIVHNCIIYDNNGCQHNYVNCVVITRGHDFERGCPAGMRYCTYRNSIICNEFGWDPFPATVTAMNNIGIKQVVFDNVADTTTNTHIDNYSEVFKTYEGGAYTDTETFELTDEAKAQYLGSDGTQVGIYGGEYPFNTNLSYPQFTKATVASKAENGKLSVNIELNGGN